MLRGTGREEERGAIEKPSMYLLDIAHTRPETVVATVEGQFRLKYFVRYFTDIIYFCVD